MCGNGFAPRFKKSTVVISILAASVALSIFAKPAQAIPVFARKYATSCITCHTIYPKLNDVGEAFRRNGYQFPSNEDILVKEDPLKLGTDAYKEMFPNSIWPSTLPSIPPVSIFTLTSTTVNVTPHGQLENWEPRFSQRRRNHWRRHVRTQHQRSIRPWIHSGGWGVGRTSIPAIQQPLYLG